MTTLGEARTAYYELSGKASDVVRQLGFAAIAVIWVFRVEGQNPPAVPESLLLPALLVIAGLFLDLLQYVIATIIWGGYSRYRERHGLGTDDVLEAPAPLNWPANLCFYSKIVLILSAYLLIGNYLFGLLEAWYSLP